MVRWIKQQRGVTRYNCADSLDRTNVGSYFGAIQVGMTRCWCWRCCCSWIYFKRRLRLLACVPHFAFDPEYCLQRLNCTLQVFVEQCRELDIAIAGKLRGPRLSLSGAARPPAQSPGTGLARPPSSGNLLVTAARTPSETVASKTLQCIEYTCPLMHQKSKQRHTCSNSP